MGIRLIILTVLMLSPIGVTPRSWADQLVIPYDECPYPLQLCIQRCIKLWNEMYIAVQKTQSVWVLPSPSDGVLGSIDLPSSDKNQIAIYQSYFEQIESEYKKRIQEKKDESRAYDEELARLNAARLDCEDKKQHIQDALKKIDHYMVYFQYIELVLETLTFVKQMEELRSAINQTVDWNKASSSDFPHQKIEDLGERYTSDQYCIIESLQKAIVNLRYHHSQFPLHYQLQQSFTTHRTEKEKAMFLQYLEDAGYTEGLFYKIKRNIDLKYIFDQLEHPGILKSQLTSAFFNVIQETGEYTDEAIIQAVQNGINALHSSTHEAIINRMMTHLGQLHHHLVHDLKNDSIGLVELEHTITTAKKLLLVWIDLETDWLQAYGDYLLNHELPLKQGSKAIPLDIPTQHFSLLSSRASWPLKALEWPDVCYSNH